MLLYLRYYAKDFLNSINKMKYLSIGPGAVGIYALIGALKGLEPELHEVQEIAGASAGSILALFMALGMSIDNILDVSLTVDISEFIKVDILSFVNKFGFVNIKTIRNKLIEICGRNPKFKELETKIHVAVFCLNTSQTEYISKDTHPNMRVIDAVCMSIAIPFLFEAGKYKGKTYIDGGMMEDVPLAPFLDKKHHEVVCMKLDMNTQFQDKISNPKQFIECMIVATIRNRASHYNNKSKTININVGDTNIFDFGIDYDAKVRLFMMGFEAI